MLESAFQHLDLSSYSDDFDQFLTLLAKEREKGRDYVALLTLPTALHYKLIQEEYVIKREEKIVTKFFFLKKIVYYYIIKPGL